MASEWSYLKYIGNFYNDTNVACIVYDITKKSTFDECKIWAIELKDSVDKVVIVGNKSDLESKRAVATSEAKHFADENNFEFQETSAVLNKGIDELAYKLDHKEISTIQEVVDSQPAEAKLEPR